MISETSQPATPMHDIVTLPMPFRPYYEAGGITIYHADCRQVLPFLQRVDLLLTDPPYGILNLESGETKAVRKSPRASGSGKLKNRMINTADFSWDSYAPSVGVLEAMRDIADTQIIWGGNYFQLPPCRGVLVWDKCQPWENFSQVELAWTNLERPAAIFKHDKSAIDGKVHPTQKPSALMKWCIGLAGDEVKTIVDPFMGAGTTLVAAKLEGRQAIGIEINEAYCEAAANRLAQGVLF
jgi:site-specific DNA-methyltransferase (adenine-specific)